MTAGGFFGVSCAPAVAAEASTITIVARRWDRMGCLSANSDADRSPRNTPLAAPVQISAENPQVRQQSAQPAAATIKFAAAWCTRAGRQPAPVVSKLYREISET